MTRSGLESGLLVPPLELKYSIMISRAMDLRSSIISLRFACALSLATYCVQLRLMLPTSAAIEEACDPGEAWETSPPKMMVALEKSCVGLRGAALGLVTGETSMLMPPNLALTFCMMFARVWSLRPPPPPLPPPLPPPPPPRPPPPRPYGE